MIDLGVFGVPSMACHFVLAVLAVFCVAWMLKVCSFIEMFVMVDLCSILCCVDVVPSLNCLYVTLISD